MKRVIIAVAMTIAILAISIYSVVKIGEFRKEAIAILSSCMQAAQQGNTQEATILATDFFNFWGELQERMVRFVRHEPLNHITSIASRLPYLASSNDQSQFLAQLNELMVDIDNLWRDELPLARNLL